VRAPVGIAIAGLGVAGSRLATALGEIPGVELRWLCDARTDLAYALRDRYTQARVADNVAGALEDDSVDAVVLALPAATHHDVALAALAADKHVLVNRPLALRSSDAAELARTASRRARVLMVSNPLLAHPATLRLEEALGGGRLGDLYYLSGTTCGPDTGSGVPLVFSHGADHVALMLRLLGDEPVEIEAVGDAYDHEGVADMAYCSLRFATGIRVQLQLSRLDARPRSELVAVGSLQTAVLDTLRPERQLALHHRRTRDVVFPGLDEDVSLRESCRRFVSAIRSVAGLSVELREAVTAVDVLEELDRAASAESAAPLPQALPAVEEGARVVSLRPGAAPSQP
jgi:predicted dehydrogenase